MLSHQRLGTFFATPKVLERIRGKGEPRKRRATETQRKPVSLKGVFLKCRRVSSFFSNDSMVSPVASEVRKMIDAHKGMREGKGLLSLAYFYLSFI